MWRSSNLTRNAHELNPEHEFQNGYRTSQGAIILKAGSLLAQTPANIPKIAEIMMTSSNGNIFRVTGPLCGEFTGHRWIPSTKAVTQSFDFFFDLRPNKQLRQQYWGWWFETLPRP